MAPDGGRPAVSADVVERTVPGAATLDWGGQSLTLLPGKAVWLPAHAMLLVADVHLGKAQSFRRLGVPVPHGTTAGTLARLSALLDATRARSLVVLGDLLHSAHARAPALQATLARWRDRHAAIEMTLVRGNHDSRAGDPPPALGIALVDEPWVPAGFARVPGEPVLALCHHGRPHPGRHVLAGHDHPCVTLDARARDRLRLPCFHFRGEVGVLPAFGDFTGMHPIEPMPQCRVYAVAGERVVPVS